MGQNNLSGRLATLESAMASEEKQCVEDDPRVIAYRKKATQRLCHLVQESKTGIKEWERLDLPGRVQYWRKKVAEAEYLIESKGVSADDDIAALWMNEVTLRIGRELSFEVASEGINEYRQMLASAEQEYNSGEFSVITSGES